MACQKTVRSHLPKAQIMDMGPRASPPNIFPGFCLTGVEKGVRRDEENIEICARCTKGVEQPAPISALYAYSLMGWINTQVTRCES